MLLAVTELSGYVGEAKRNCKEYSQEEYKENCSGDL